MDRQHLYFEVLGVEQNFGARNGEFAEPAVAKAAAHGDALGLVPGLGFEERPRYVDEVLREILDGAVHDCRSFAVVTDQRSVKFFLADIFGRLLPEWVFARFAQRLPPLFESFQEGGFAGAIPEECFLILHCEVETIALDPRQPADRRKRATSARFRSALPSTR